MFSCFVLLKFVFLPRHQETTQTQRMNGNFYISPRAITITPNAENNNPDYVGISVVGGTAIRVRNRISEPDGNGGSTTVEIGYAADLSYRKWTLTGGNTYVGNDHSYALNIYARLDASNNGDRGIVMLSKENKNLEVTTETGHYYFIKIGELSAPQQNGLRELTEWDTGELDTNQGINNEKNGDFDKAFTLGSQHITPKLPFYGLQLFANTGITFLTNSFFKFGTDGRAISELKTTVSNAVNDFASWAVSNAIATTESIVSYCRSFFLRKDADDTTAHKLTMNSMACTGNNLPSGAFAADITGDAKISGTTQMHGGFIAGDQTSQTQNYVENVRGSKLYWNGSGWQFDCDYLHVNKKAFFKEVEIDKASHIGGQQILTACGCVVEHVYLNRYGSSYYIFFAKEDKDGKPVTNDWKVGDLAYCQTFNVKEGVSQDVSNRYYWTKVLYITDYTMAAELTDSITGETFNPSKYHRIVIKCTNTQGQAPNCDIPSLNADGTPCVDINKNVSDTPTIGDNIVLMGHVKQPEETEQEARERQGATLLAGAGQWQQALVMWTGIGADANNPFVMPEPQVVISPRGVKIVADEIALKSSGQLLLTSNQLKCTNLEGRTTLGLDAYGNAFFSGPVNQMSLSAIGENYNIFFEVLNKTDRENVDSTQLPYSGTGKLLTYFTDLNYDDTGMLFNLGDHEEAESGISFLPDMMRLNGVVHLGDIEGADGLVDEDSEDAEDFDASDKDVDIILPFCVPIFLEQDRDGNYNVIGNQTLTHFDICRTPTHSDEQHHLITWNEMNAIVGRKITFHNSSTSNVFYIKFPRMQETNVDGDIYYRFANPSFRYGGAQLSPGRFVTVEYVAKPVLCPDSYDATITRQVLGIFPIVNADNFYDSPEGYTNQWGNDEITI